MLRILQGKATIQTLTVNPFINYSFRICSIYPLCFTNFFIYIKSNIELFYRDSLVVNVLFFLNLNLSVIFFCPKIYAFFFHYIVDREEAGDISSKEAVDDEAEIAVDDLVEEAADVFSEEAVRAQSGEARDQNL